MGMGEHFGKALVICGIICALIGAGVTLLVVLAIKFLT